MKRHDGDRHNSSTEETHHLLEVDDLRIDFHSRHGHVHAVRGVSLHVGPGETLGLVGESGSGKSVTAQAMLGLVEPPGVVGSGDVRWKGESLLVGAGAKRVANRVRGSEIGMVFQDPMTSLNPLFTVGAQVMEVLRHHLGMTRRQARQRAIDLLDLVGISSPGRRVDQHPHELSGGMRQRVLIAMALACEPELLVADEPTTALDVTVQAQIFELLREIQDELELAVILITHDLGVVADFCERLAVMYAGRIMESGSASSLFSEPGHPYTAGLLRAMPRPDLMRDRLVAIEGNPPDLRNPPGGCAFNPRCPSARAECRTSDPVLIEHRADHRVACHEAFDFASSETHVASVGTAP